MAGGVCWHLGRREVCPMAWGDPGPDPLLEHTRIFLSGINEDQMPEALKTNLAPPGFLRLPIWISSGINDHIATPSQEEQVKGSLVRTGFQNVRLSRFSGGHEVNRADLQSALKWFREQARF